MKKTILTIYLIVLTALAIAYWADPARRKTARLLQPAGQQTARDNMLSSLNVTAVAEDNNGLMWIGTSAGINVYDGHAYTQYFHDTDDASALPDDYINTLHRDRCGRMWAGTQNGVAVYCGAGRFRRFALPPDDSNVVQIADGRHNGEVLVFTERQHRTRCHAIEADGTVVAVATAHRPATGQVAIPDAPYSLRKPAQMVSCTFLDSRGNVWVGYRNAGYQVVSPSLTAQKRANDNALARATAGKDVVTTARVGSSMLAGTTLRLFVYDASSGSVGERFLSDLFDSVPGARRTLVGIVPLDGRRAWLIGNRQVLSCRTDGHLLHIEGKVCGSDGMQSPLGSGARVGDRLYVTSDSVLLETGYGTAQPRRMNVGSPWYDDETQLATLHDGNVLLFMRNMHLMLLHTKNRRLQPLHTTGTPQHGNTDPAFALQDSRGIIWLGTKRSGLYSLDLRTGRMERADFAGDVHIQGMAEDSSGRLWISTLKDVVCYTPSTRRAMLCSQLSSSQNSWQRQYFDKAICTTADGGMALGSSDGCIMTGDTRQYHGPAVAETAGMHVYALDITTQGGRRLSLGDTIANGSSYTLAHDENTLCMRFLSPHYGASSAHMFQYMLSGYDTEWHKPTHGQEATYEHLPPGHYTFRLRLMSSPDLPPAAERTIEFSIRPAWWASAPAWMLYAGVVACVLFLFNSLYLRLRTDSMRLAQERHEREREQRTNEMNMSFFANISHEFRNPITIIAGPLMSLRADTSLPPAVQQTLDRVCMSVNRMLRLIDQMLDFNQLETDALRLRVGSCNVAHMLQPMLVPFEESARVRGITLVGDTSAADGTAWLDADKIEKILGNLFTNALKHTPDGGEIDISASIGTGNDGVRMLTISVYNSGSHIPEANMQDVFKRYYQLADTAGTHHYGWGTGIGLYYVHRLVMLHHGHIAVANTDNGVRFCCTLPADESAYCDAEHTQGQGPGMLIPPMSMPELAARGNGGCNDSGGTPSAQPGGMPSAQHGDTPASGSKKTKILVVDDDIDVAQYIRSLFCDRYDVVNRYSAEDALADIGEVRPDIVLSDVIMGKMSGYTFCRRLKGDIMFSHIPVVMITAKSNMDEQINGLRLGAVAYVTKPFDPAYLQAIVASQLQNQQMLRQQLGQSTSTDGLPEAAGETMSEQDRHFMDELYALMERRSAELELNVSTVCHDLLISQSKFNYKLKQLTGDTPGTFFRKYKLNRAAQMLREGRHTVAEVALLTGFGTAAHFSVAFKKQFGTVPSEYGKRVDK